MNLAQALILLTICLLIGVSDAQESTTKKSRAKVPYRSEDLSAKLLKDTVAKP